MYESGAARSQKAPKMRSLAIDPYNWPRAATCDKHAAVRQENERHVANVGLLRSLEFGKRSSRESSEGVSGTSIELIFLWGSSPEHGHVLSHGVFIIACA